MPNSEPNILMQLDIRKGILKKVSNSKILIKTIQMYTGLSKREMTNSLKQKEAVLKWLVKNNINTVETVGRIMAEYYTNLDNLMLHVRKNKMLGD